MSNNKTALTVGHEGDNGKAKRLKPKERLFVNFYVRNGGNATLAYGQAGYAKRKNRSAASVLLNKPYIQDAIQKLLAASGYTPDGLRSRLMIYADNDPSQFGPFLDGSKTLEELAGEGVDTRTVSEALVIVKPGKDGDHVTHKLRWHDSQQATTTLAKMHGLLDERKRIELSGMVGVGALDLRDKTDEELEALRVAMCPPCPECERRRMQKMIAAGQDPQTVTQVVGSEIVQRELVEETMAEQERKP